MNIPDLNNLPWNNIRTDSYIATAYERFVIYVTNIERINAQYNWRYIVIDLESTVSVTERINMKGCRHGIYTNLTPTKEMTKSLITEVINEIFAAEKPHTIYNKDTRNWP